MKNLMKMTLGFAILTFTSVSAQAGCCWTPEVVCCNYTCVKYCADINSKEDLIRILQTKQETNEEPKVEFSTQQ